MSSRFSRSLPLRPDLAQQKKQAKELLRAFDAGDAEALARVRAELPDKQDIALADAQFVLAREYGFTDWAELRQHIDAQTEATRSPLARMHDALQRRDPGAIRRLFAEHEEFRSRINDPVFSFNSPAIVAYANDPAIVEVLLELGADPNRRSTWLGRRLSRAVFRDWRRGGATPCGRRRSRCVRGGAPRPAGSPREDDRRAAGMRP